MMKRLKPEELPEVLTDEIIEILVGMAQEFPKSTFDWDIISKVLRERGQLELIFERRRQIEEMQTEFERNGLPPKEGEQEKETWDHVKLDKKKFYGNMFEPETPEEYKFKYGKQPPGYDENGKEP